MVCYGENEKRIGRGYVDQVIWETGQYELSYLLIERNTDLRGVQEQIGCAASLLFESFAKARYGLFVVNSGLNQFQLRFRMEL
jgi:hypothetical protein